MAVIPSPLRIEHIQGTRQWIVTDWFRFESDVLGRTVTVPPGFITDFHSIPRGLWNILPPDDNPESAVVHDRLYARNGCTRKQADQVHAEVLRVLGAKEWKVKAMYAGLRIGGWKSWNKYRKQQKANHV
jgi:hypothetical protein